MLPGINNRVLAEMMSLLWTHYLTQDITGSVTINPWSVSEHAPCWVNPLVTPPAWMAMGNRAQYSVRFRTIQGGGQAHVPVSASTSNWTEKIAPSALTWPLGSNGVYALMSHHSTNVQLETGKSRGPCSPRIFQWRYPWGAHWPESPLIWRDTDICPCKRWLSA